MVDLNQLLAQKAELEKKIADAQREERSSAIAKVRAMMSEYGLSLADLGSKSSPAPVRTPSPGGSKKVAAKYMDRATGQAWSGRGLKPNWLKAALASGRSIDEFTV